MVLALTSDQVFEQLPLTDALPGSFVGELPLSDLLRDLEEGEAHRSAEVRRRAKFKINPEHYDEPAEVAGLVGGVLLLCCMIKCCRKSSRRTPAPARPTVVEKVVVVTRDQPAVQAQTNVTVQQPISREDSLRRKLK